MSASRAARFSHCAHWSLLLVKPGRQHGQQSIVQVGYLNQYLLKADGLRAERNHTAQLALALNLDLRRKAGQ